MFKNFISKIKSFLKAKDNKQMEVTYDKKSVTKFKQWKFKRQIIVSFFIIVILAFLTCLGVLIYQNLIIKQHQPPPNKWLFLWTGFS
ncbi:hypothetical protein SMM_1058 [Spiroplasma mirum ATCC 29335]|nr:hypothetical protein SMM_1058 [Spiroplasma mirum ATCC 29335]